MMYNPRKRQEINYEYTRHAKRRQQEQDTGLAEVALTVENGALIEVRGNKGSRTRVFRAGYTHRDVYYPDKELRVVYAMEKDSVVVVTIVTRYGRFE